MSVIQPSRRGPRPASCRRASGRARESSTVFMNAPSPVLTSKTMPVVPDASFFERMRGHDERDRFDGSGHVAQRVEDPVRRRDGVRLGEEGRADFLQDLPDRRQVEVRAESRDRRELVERAARVAEPAAGHHATRAPAAATSGASTRETLSPTPPVECLSTTGARSERSQRLPGVPHRFGEGRRLGGGEAADDRRHQERGTPGSPGSLPRRRPRSGARSPRAGAPGRRAWPAGSRRPFSWRGRCRGERGFDLPAPAHGGRVEDRFLVECRGAAVLRAAACRPPRRR